MMAAMGQLRGLRHLGLLDKARYISGISGGAWATTMYCYVPDHLSDDDLLGGVCEDPAELTFFKHAGEDPAAELNWLHQHSLGRVPGRLSYTELAEMGLEALQGKIPASEIWARLVGTDFLSHFNRYSGFGKSPYFTLDKQWFSRWIEPHNPHLEIDDFYTFPADRYRPYLLVWGSLLPREAVGDYELLPMLFSPCWAGVLSDFAESEEHLHPVGGGAIDPFGLASIPGTKEPGSRLEVSLAANRFSLADMVGITSSFYAQGLATEHPELDGLIPEYLYWPVSQHAQKDTRQYGFADGGSLEDTGVAGTLRFAPDSVISFINSPTPLSWDEKYNCPIVDAQIPPLFGYQPYLPGSTGGEQGMAYEPYPDKGSGKALLEPSFESFRHNQVFPREAFPELLQQMWGAVQRGGTVFCCQPELPTLANHKFGVSEGRVNMLWVYNNPVREWETQLSTPVKAYLELDPFMRHFPCYPTADSNLSARQVNMLAHLSCWNIISGSTAGSCEGLSNRRMIERMFSA